jgi:hypothetical protein
MNLFFLLLAYHLPLATQSFWISVVRSLPASTPVSIPASLPTLHPRLSIQISSAKSIEEPLLQRQLKKEARGPLMACYRAQLRRDPSWEGEMKTTLWVAASGEVLFVTPMKGPKRFTSCVQDVFAGLSIDAPYNCGVAEASFVLRWST